MTFIETEVIADISEIEIGGVGDNTINIPLTFDRSGGGAPSGPIITAEVMEGPLPHPSPPFGVAVAEEDEGRYTMMLTFDKPFAEVNPGKTYTVRIDDSHDIDVTIAYAYGFHPIGWENVDGDGDTVGGIDPGAPIQTKPANQRWLAIFRTALAAWQNARSLLHFYFYKHKYLNDILQFSTITHTLPENAESEISYHPDGRIKEVTITYPNRERHETVRAQYEYDACGVSRYSAPTDTSPIETGEETLLMKITVDVVDPINPNMVIKTLGEIEYIREPTRVEVPFAPNYDNGLSPISAINQLSHFKHYEVQAMTGYRVKAW